VPVAVTVAPLTIPLAVTFTTVLMFPVVSIFPVVPSIIKPDPAGALAVPVVKVPNPRSATPPATGVATPAPLSTIISFRAAYALPESAAVTATAMSFILNC
jgi:hypothetical protein